MATATINWGGIALRFVGAMALIAATYNPEGYSFYHWVKGGFTQPTALMAFVAVVLLIGYTVFFRATARSLGSWGVILASLFFGTLLWLVIDYGIVPVSGIRAISYIMMVIMASILAAGMSWSHIRARISGQGDVADLDD